MGLRAEFRDMKDSTAEDWSRIIHEFLPFAARLPERVLDHLKLLQGDCGGFAVDQLTHSLQTASGRRITEL